MLSLADVCSCVRRLHPDLRSRVSPETLNKYKIAMDEFVVYTQQRFDIVMQSPDDLDLLLLEFRTEAELTKSKHNLLVAAAEFFLPHVRGKLVLSREALKGRANVETVHHTIPLPQDCAFLVAALHASRGQPRLGIAVLLQQSTGLRPSELLGIRAEHVFIPERLSDLQRISIRLGIEVSTKVKREQCVLLDRYDEPSVYCLLEWVVCNTQHRNRLFPFSYSFYNNSFKLVEQHFRLQVGWTAHSGRAGFATDRVARGVPAAEVQGQGRWLSDSSFRCYIDVVGSLAIKAQVASQDLAGTALWCKTHILQYFEPWLHGQEPCRFRGSPRATGPPPEGEPIPDPTSSGGADKLWPSKMAGGTTSQFDGTFSSTGSTRQRGSTKQPTSWPSSKGKGKGRGKLLVRDQKGSIFA